MARLTGRIVAQEYTPGKRENSFYQEQVWGDKIDGDYILEHSKTSTVYYGGREMDCIKEEETYLMDGK